jgi:hypothetical protein
VSRRAIAVAVLAVALGGASRLFAQTNSAAGRVELAVGATWTGRAAMGQQAANETQSNGAARALFSSASELGSAPGMEARVGVRAARRLQIEANASYGVPQLRVTTSADVESAAGVTATDRLQQYTLGAAAVWLVPIERLGPRTVPFVTGGAAYVRQLHEGGTLAQSGRLFDVGGGIERLLAARAGRRVKAVGIRGDVRARVRSSSVTIDGRAHAAPIVGGSLFVRF